MKRGAIIGLGNVAANGHLPGWLARPDITIVAAADADPGRRACLQGAGQDVAWYADADALLAEETLDFVDICTPPAAHAALIRAALEADLNVLCEKPLVTCAEDAVPLIALARARGHAVHTVHNWLYAPPARAITAALSRGEVGRVQRLRWETLRTKPAVTVVSDGAINWRTDPAIAGGGILVDHGWHALYCVARWMGVAPETVAARLETRKHREWQLEDTATVTLAGAGVTAEIFLSWAAASRENSVVVEGSDGALHLEGATLTVTAAGRPSEARPCPPALSEGSHHPDRFAGVVDDFLAALDAETPCDVANLAEADLCARLIAGAKASDAAGGVPVPVA